MIVLKLLKLLSMVNKDTVRTLLLFEQRKEKKLQRKWGSLLHRYIVNVLEKEQQIKATCVFFPNLERHKLAVIGLHCCQDQEKA